MLSSINDIYKYRSLIAALVGRHLSMRYRGSVLGFLWSFLNPLCLMLIYTLVFKYYIRFSGVPNYTIFVFCGLLPWIWTTSALVESTASIAASGHLITKSLFPAQILPLVATLTNLINFLLALPLLFIFMAFAGMQFHLSLVFLPILILLQFLFLTALGTAAAAINVSFRDVQHLLGNVLTFVFFLCPIVYPASTVPEQWKFTMLLNPIALLIQSYHQIVIEGAFPSLINFGYLLAWTALMLLISKMVYGKFSDRFAEML